MAKMLSGWYRMFIVFAGVWTILAAFLLYILFPDKEYIEDVFPDKKYIEDVKIAIYLFPLYWLFPVGLVYVFGWCVGWIIRGFRKEN